MSHLSMHITAGFYWILLQLKQTSRWSFKGLKLDEERRKKFYCFLLFCLSSFHSYPLLLPSHFILPKDINPFKLIPLTPVQSFLIHFHIHLHLTLICFVFSVPFCHSLSTSSFVARVYKYTQLIFKLQRFVKTTYKKFISMAFPTYFWGLCLRKHKGRKMRKRYGKFSSSCYGDVEH